MNLNKILGWISIGLFLFSIIVTSFSFIEADGFINYFESMMMPTFTVLFFSLFISTSYSLMKYMNEPNDENRKWMRVSFLMDGFLFLVIFVLIIVSLNGAMNLFVS